MLIFTKHSSFKYCTNNASLQSLLRHLFILLAISGISADLHGQFCIGDPIPANQQDLRGNTEYKVGECPANDIQILGAMLDTGDDCNSCNQGDQVTANLIITIHHNTNSANRYLGIYADLDETLNGSTSSCDIARCAGPVLKSSDEVNGQQVLDYGPITFTCGSTLELSDILLVWTAANGSCPVTPANNPNGKYCYDNGVILITPPLNASLTAECGQGNTTNIDLTVTGGSGNFSYSWSNGSTSEDLMNVPFGTYTVTVYDNEKLDAQGDRCQVSESISFNGPCCEFSVVCPLPDLGEYPCGSPPPCATTVDEFEALDGTSDVGNNPCGEVIIICNDNPAPTALYCSNQLITRTYTLFDDLNSNGALDQGEESMVCEQTYTMLPPSGPSVLNPPGPVTVACDAIPNPITLNYSNGEVGNCLISGTVKSSDTPHPGPCGGFITRNWNAGDDVCGNQIPIVTQTITVQPAPQASFTGLPGDISITCSAAPPIGSSLSYTNGLSDHCVISGSVSGSISGTHDECGGTYIESWTFTDDCNRTITHSRSITVQPAPQASFTDLPGDISITCSAAPPTGSSLSYTNGLSDHCVISGSVSGSISGTHDECGGTYIESWTFTDDCNRTITHSRTITVQPAPQASFTGLPGDISITCSAAPPIGSSLSYTNGLSDHCVISGSVSGSISGTHDEGGGTYIESWTFTDDCNRTITHSRTITAQPAPQASFTDLPGDISITCSAAPPIGSSLSYTNGLSDPCVISGSVSGSISGTHDECGGTYIESWTFTDDCNRTITHSRTITVQPAPQASFTDLPGDISITCSAAPPTGSSLSYTNGLSDHCVISGSVSGSILGTHDECGACTYVESWTFTDDCNRTITHSRNITVEPAQISGQVCPAGSPVLCFEDLEAKIIEDSAAIANSIQTSCDLEVEISVARPDFTDNCNGTQYEAIFHLNSICQSQIEPCTVTYTIEHTRPSVVCPTEPVSVPPCTDPTDQWNTWINTFAASGGDCNGSVQLLVNGQVSTELPTLQQLDPCGDEVTIELIASNDCIAETVRCSSTFTIEAEETLEAVCPSDVVVPEEQTQEFVNNAFQDWLNGFGYLGGCDVQVTYQIDDIPVDPSTLTPPDRCGDDLALEIVVESPCQRDSCTSTFIVVAGVGELILSPLPGQLAECSNLPEVPSVALLPEPMSPEEIISLFVISTSSCTDMSALLVEESLEGPQVIGIDYIFTRTYTVSGSNTIGAASTSEQYIFTHDPDPPVLSGLPMDLELPCGSEIPPPPEVTGYDIVAGEITPVMSEKKLPSSCGEGVQRTWTATDECGNMVTGVQTITFSDDQPPELDVPGDTVIYCPGIIPMAEYTSASDNCSEFDVTLSEEQENHNTCEFTLTRTWVARDRCGNSVTKTQIIEFRDTTPPEIIVINPMLQDIPNGGDLIVYDCVQPQVAMSDIIATDECCEVSVVMDDILKASDVCHIFGYYRRWECYYEATDAAGNMSRFHFNVLQYDTTAPTIFGVEPYLEIECDSMVPPPADSVYGFDECVLSDTTELVEATYYNPEDSSEFALVRTWSKTDHCGNRGEATQIIAVCGFDTTLISGSLGNRVWLDANANGMQDEGEPGINGVVVHLFRIDSSQLEPRIMAGTTVTDRINGDDGQFRFDFLLPGLYQLQFMPPENLGLTLSNQGDSDQTDSDADPATGMTDIISLQAGEKLDGWDAGFAAASALPVELAVFHVDPMDCENKLSWTTLSEIGSEYFEVERSYDGRAFEPLGVIKAKGDVTLVTDYVFMDNDPKPVNYYRLKMVDLDGSVQYSDLVISGLNCSSILNTEIQVYPNPVSDEATIELELFSKTKVILKLYDKLGSEVKTYSTVLPAGVHKHRWDFSDLPNGIYLIYVSTTDTIQNRMIIKRN